MENILSLGFIGSWIAVVIATAIFCRQKWPNNKELSRKIVHIGNGPVIPLAWLLQIPQGTANSKGKKIHDRHYNKLNSYSLELI